MKNGVLALLVLFSFCLVGCDDSQPIVEVQTNEYPIAEQLCIDNDGEVTTDYNGVPVCIFFADEWCTLENIEKGGCEYLDIEYEGDMPPSVYCEENGGEPQVWQEGGEESEVCWFKDDETFCYLNDFADGSCKQGDMTYYD